MRGLQSYKRLARISQAKRNAVDIRLVRHKGKFFSKKKKAKKQKVKKMRNFAKLKTGLTAKGYPRAILSIFFSYEDSVFTSILKQ